MTSINKAMIKKIQIMHVLCLIIVAFSHVAIAQNLDKTRVPQAGINKNTAINSKPNTTADSAITNRDIEIDLEKLSQIATLHARGTLISTPSNGLVVLNVDIDSTGAPVAIYAVEVSDEIWRNPAIDAIHVYTKRHKIKPALKDGKPIKTKNNLIPVVFDMSIFDKK